MLKNKFRDTAQFSSKSCNFDTLYMVIKETKDT